jgi:hypothetical protein
MTFFLIFKLNNFGIGDMRKRRGIFRGWVLWGEREREREME